MIWSRYLRCWRCAICAINYLKWGYSKDTHNCCQTNVSHLTRPNLTHADLCCWHCSSAVSICLLWKYLEIFPWKIVSVVWDKCLRNFHAGCCVFAVETSLCYFGQKVGSLYFSGSYLINSFDTSWCWLSGIGCAKMNSVESYNWYCWRWSGLTNSAQMNYFAEDRKSIKYSWMSSGREDLGGSTGSGALKCCFIQTRPFPQIFRQFSFWILFTNQSNNFSEGK